MRTTLAGCRGRMHLRCPLVLYTHGSPDLNLASSSSSVFKSRSLSPAGDMCRSVVHLKLVRDADWSNIAVWSTFARMTPAWTIIPTNCHRTSRLALAGAFLFLLSLADGVVPAMAYAEQLKAASLPETLPNTPHCAILKCPVTREGSSTQLSRPENKVLQAATCT